MKIRLITVGDFKSGGHRSIADEYVKRLGRHTSFEHIVIKREADIGKRLHSADFLVLCDEKGKSYTSKELAQFIEKKQMEATKSLTLAIGPAEGWNTEAKKRANATISLSKFTLQHDLATLVLLEQIYRAYTIIKGEPYHK